MTLRKSYHCVARGSERYLRLRNWLPEKVEVITIPFLGNQFLDSPYSFSFFLPHTGSKISHSDCVWTRKKRKRMSGESKGVIEWMHGQHSFYVSHELARITFLCLCLAISSCATHTFGRLFLSRSVGPKDWTLSTVERPHRESALRAKSRLTQRMLRPRQRLWPVCRSYSFVSLTTFLSFLFKFSRIQE